MITTPLQNGLGHVFGPGIHKKSDGAFPVWLEQDKSRILGGTIDLSEIIDDTSSKIGMFYPKSIRTGTPCVDRGGHSYAPIPTYLVVEKVLSTSTKVKVAKQDGLAVPIQGISVASAKNTSKTASIDSVTEADNYYELTIEANSLETLEEGDVLILEGFVSLKPVGLTKSNLDYDGADIDETKLTVTLIDTGRIMEDAAPAVTEDIKQALQTIKWEKVF